MTLPVVKKEKKEMQVVPDPVNEKHSSSHRHNAHSILSASGHSTHHRSAERKKYIFNTLKAHLVLYNMKRKLSYYYFFCRKMKLSESERPSPCHQLACTTSWTCLIFSIKLPDSQISNILRYYILRQGIPVSGTISHCRKKIVITWIAWADPTKSREESDDAAIWFPWRTLFRVDS